MFSAVKKYVLFLKSNETEFGKVNKITQDIGTSGLSIFIFHQKIQLDWSQ